MLKINNKLVLLLLSFLSLILLSSCSYETTTVNLGSGFDSTWAFSNSSDYEFDENFVEVVNGKAQLKVLDLEHSGDDFNSGSYVGAFVDSSNNLSLLKSDLVSNSINSILPEETSSLRGYWRLEGSFQGEVGGLHGTPTGDVVMVNDSKVDSQSASFDGAADYIVLPNSTQLSPGTSDFTVSAWFKTTMDGSTNHWIYGDYGSLGNSLVAIIYDANERINGYYRDISGTLINITTTNSYDDDLWHHVVWVKNGTEATLYVDGILQGQSNNPALIDIDVSDAENPLIGSYPRNPSAQEFLGKIDEVSIWGSALTSKQVSRLFDAQQGLYNTLSATWTPKYDSLIGYWKMDGNWQDSSGNNISGIANGDSSFSSQSKVGSSSGTYDGVGDFIDFGMPASLDFGVSSFTVSGWFKTSSDSDNWRYIYRNGQNAVSGFIIAIARNGLAQGNKLFFEIKGGTGALGTTASNLVLNSGSWHYFTAVRDQDTISLYVDGILQDKSSLPPGTLINAATNNTIGEVFPGEIDDISIWNIALDSSEIMQIYEKQKQKYAGHYDSEVIDLGSTTTTWPDLSWSTSLPFGKELVGDFDNDGNPDSDSSSDYTFVGSNLGSGLIGLWSFNEKSANTAPNLGSGNTDFNDHSIENGHGIEVGGVSFNKTGVFGSTVELDGVDDYIDFYSYSVAPQNLETTFSIWFNVKRLGIGHGILSYGAQSGCTPSTISFLVVSNGALRASVGCGSSVSSSSGLVKPGEWYNLLGITSPLGLTSLFLNGVEIIAPIDIRSGQNIGTANLIIGGSWSGGSVVTYAEALIDEFAVWNRTLSQNEIQQLYRRGANRIKFQVKSCVDSSCNCKSFGVGGSETDCDGDTILNTADTDDIHKSEFIGPGGDGTTYYSEAFNRTNTEVTFNCALNITDSDAGVCAPDEITLTAGPKPTGPEFLNIDYTQFVTPQANRYAQYRVYMEADENTACGGEPCLPELTSVSLNPTGATRYSSEYIKIKPKSPITFTKLISAEIDAENCVTFRLSRSNTEYYFDGTSWVSVTTDVHRNTASEVESNITKFASDHGAGELEVNAYLASDASQSTQCSVNSIDIKYE